MFESTSEELLEQIETLIQAAKLGKILRDHVSATRNAPTPLSEFDSDAIEEKSIEGFIAEMGFTVASRVMV